MIMFNAVRRLVACLRGQHIEITMVSDSEVFITIRARTGVTVFRHENLLPNRRYVLNGIAVRTISCVRQ